MRQRILQQEIKRLGLLLRQEEAAHLASKGSFKKCQLATVNTEFHGDNELEPNKENLRRQKSDLKAKMDLDFDAEKAKVIADSASCRSQNAKNFESTNSNDQKEHDVSMEQTFWFIGGFN